ncbi:MAG TPA: hypothetical protein VKX41_16965 [Alloacidobacterium sp.]|nr:hypothetical protein [Alloacidobacterium sp.]
MRLSLRRKSILLGGILAISALALIAAQTSNTRAERRHTDTFGSKDACDARDRVSTATFDAWWYQHDTRLEQWYREKFRRLSPLEQFHLAAENR